MQCARPARIWSYLRHIEAHAAFLAVYDKYVVVDAFDGRIAVDLEAWKLIRPMYLPRRVWSSGQRELIDAVEIMVTVSGANEHQLVSPHARTIHVGGEPGNGKTEAIIYAAVGINDK